MEDIAGRTRLGLQAAEPSPTVGKVPLSLPVWLVQVALRALERISTLRQLQRFRFSGYVAIKDRMEEVETRCNYNVFLMIPNCEASRMSVRPHWICFTIWRRSICRRPKLANRERRDDEETCTLAMCNQWECSVFCEPWHNLTLMHGVVRSTRGSRFDHGAVSKLGATWEPLGGRGIFWQ